VTTSDPTPTPAPDDAAAATLDAYADAQAAWGRAVGRLPGTPADQAAEASAREALRRARLAALEALGEPEAVRRDGSAPHRTAPPPSAGRGLAERVAVRLPAPILARLDAAAAALGVTRQEALRRAVEAWPAAGGPPTPGR
jgi:hypothetical protein